MILKRKAAKLISVLLSAVIVVTCMPAVSFGASFERSEVRKVSSDLDMIRQYIEDEAIDYQQYPITKKYYHQDILEQYNKYYTQLMKCLDEATSVDELGSIDYFEGVEIIGIKNDEVNTCMAMLSVLPHYTRDLYNKKADFTRLKKDHLEYLDQFMSSQDKAHYTDWYWDIIKREGGKAYSNIKKATNFTELMTAMEESYIVIEMIDSSTDTYDYDFSMDNYIYLVWHSSILTKESLSYYIDLMEAAIKKSVRDMKAIDRSFKLSSKTEKLADSFVDKASKKERLEDVIALFESVSKAIKNEIDAFLEKKGGERLTESDKIRFMDRMYEYRFSFNREEYSDWGWESMDDYLDHYQERISSCIYIVQAVFVESIFQKTLQQVMTEKQELKEEKKRVRQRWAYYKNKRMFNQKKVKKILKNANAALNKLKKVDDVEIVGWRYASKLEKTIYRFNVSVTKKGHGSVSKGRKVEYGDTYSLKISPAPGYKLKSVTINGKKKKLKYQYKITVKQKQKIKVVFS